MAELLFLRLPVLSSAQGFMVIERRVVSYDIIVPLFVNGIKQIHIVEGHRQLLAKSAGLTKYILSNHQAGSCHGKHIVDSTVHPKIMILTIT